MVNCPHCKTAQGQQATKSWSYGQITVKRLKCTCGKTFNHYVSNKGKEWTVPKPK